MFNKLRLITLLISIALFSGCGVAEDILTFDGPILDISELESMEIDQLYFAEAGADEAGTPDFSVYIMDVGSGEYIACVGGDDLIKADAAGVYFGGLEAPTQILLDEFEGLNVKVVFVEKDSDPCPAAINPDYDETIGESAVLKGVDLLNTTIGAENGKARVMFKTYSADNNSVALMDATNETALIIDQIYVDEGDYDEEGIYFLYVSSEGVDCEIEQPTLPLKYAGLVYGWLNLKFDCLENVDIDKKVSITLWKNDGKNMRMIASIPESKIADLIQEKVNFTEENGYVWFRDVESAQ